MWNDHDFLQLHDAHKHVDHIVNFVAIVLEFGLPKTTKGTDYCCTLRVIDETHHQTAMAVMIFAENAQNLPHVAAAGDVIHLRRMVRDYAGEVNAVFNKRISSFALYKGKDGDDLVPYQVSSKFHPRYEDKLFVVRLRRWLVNFRPGEDSGNFPMLRDIKEGTNTNLACKILHCYRAENNQWFIYAWDGSDTPPNAISSKLEDEVKTPLPLRLEPSPMPKELICTLPTVGSILRIIFGDGIVKNHLHLPNPGEWVKFANIRLEVCAGLWHGVFTPTTMFRYTPSEDPLITERLRLFNERMTLMAGTKPSFSFPKPSHVTEVDHARVPPVSLMTVLVHSEKVTAKFKCIVRVVAAVPCQAENLCSPDGSYLMQLTLEDSTARIIAFVADENGETLFGGYPGIEELTEKLNRLLGIAECDDSTGVKDTPRNPPWVCVCLKSYYGSKLDLWGSRSFRIFDTRIVGDA